MVAAAVVLAINNYNALECQTGVRGSFDPQRFFGALSNLVSVTQDYGRMFMTDRNTRNALTTHRGKRGRPSW